MLFVVVASIQVKESVLVNPSTQVSHVLEVKEQRLQLATVQL